MTPAHYYHDIGAAQNISQLIVDGFGWSNAVPNAKATVKMTINGTQLQFTGAGYHDKVGVSCLGARARMQWLTTAELGVCTNASSR